MGMVAILDNESQELSNQYLQKVQSNLIRDNKFLLKKV